MSATLNNPKELLTLVVPVYNEEACIAATWGELLPLAASNNYRVLFVNDGSKDGTAHLLAQFQDFEHVNILHHKLNKGYGAALKTGLRQVKTRYAISFDADGQHSLESVQRLLASMIQHDADLVIGNRNNKHSGFLKNIGKALIKILSGFLFKLEISDLNSGLKIFETKTVRNYLSLCPNGMAFSEVIVLIYISQRFRIVEEPITVLPRLAGESHIRFRHAFESVFEILSAALLFNPFRIFLTLSLILIVLSLGWGIPILLQGRGLSVGASSLFLFGILTLFFGFMFQQITRLKLLIIEQAKD